MSWYKTFTKTSSRGCPDIDVDALREWGKNKKKNIMLNYNNDGMEDRKGRRADHRERVRDPIGIKGSQTWDVMNELPINVRSAKEMNEELGL